MKLSLKKYVKIYYYFFYFFSFYFYFPSKFIITKHNFILSWRSTKKNINKKYFFIFSLL